MNYSEEEESEVVGLFVLVEVSVLDDEVLLSLFDSPDLDDRPAAPEGER